MFALILIAVAIVNIFSIAGVRIYPMPLSDGAVPSVRINAADARWA